MQKIYVLTNKAYQASGYYFLYYAWMIFIFYYFFLE